MTKKAKIVNTKTPRETDPTMAAFRAARSSSEDTFELGTARVRVTSTPAGIVVAIDDFAGGAWIFRKGSAIECSSRAQAEGLACALFVSERLRAERGAK